MRWFTDPTGAAKETAWSMLTDFLASLHWTHYAVAFAGLLALLGMAGLVLGAPMKRASALGALSFTLLAASWYCWPPAPPPPPPGPGIDWAEQARRAKAAAEAAARAARDLALLAVAKAKVVSAKVAEAAAEAARFVAEAAAEGADGLMRFAHLVYEKIRANVPALGLPEWRTDEELAAIRERERLRDEEDQARLALEEKARKQAEKDARHRWINGRKRQRALDAAERHDPILREMFAAEQREMERLERQAEAQRRIDQERNRRFLNGGRP